MLVMPNIDTQGWTYMSASSKDNATLLEQKATQIKS